MSFEQYASAIKEANLVVTNRLHVALPSASIGNTTILIDSGYHKLRGVYERSLSKVPNIFFLERP